MPIARNINNLYQNAREIIRWAFSVNASKMKFSPVFELDNAYVISYLVAKKEEGDAHFERGKRASRDSKVRNEKRQLWFNLSFKGLTTLREMKAVFPRLLHWMRSQDLKLSTFVFPGVGFATKVNRSNLWPPKLVRWPLHYKKIFGVVVRALKYAYSQLRSEITLGGSKAPNWLKCLSSGHLYQIRCIARLAECWKTIAINSSKENKNHLKTHAISMGSCFKDQIRVLGWKQIFWILDQLIKGKIRSNGQFPMLICLSLSFPKTAKEEKLPAAVFPKLKWSFKASFWEICEFNNN